MAENDGLLELAQAAKRAGAEGLYRAYSGRLFSFVLRMLNDAHAAQDVTVEAFKTAFREVVTFTSAAGFLLKLYERAYHESYQRAMAIAPGKPEWREVDPEAFVGDEEKLQDALRGVPPKERGLWLLRLEGLTDVETAFAAGYDVKAADVGARVKDAIALAKRHFLAALSTEPAMDGAKAAEVADQLGLMFTRKPAPPQTWATLDRTLRAERIVADEAAPDEAPKRGGGSGGPPWMVIGVVAVVALIGLGIGLRACGTRERDDVGWRRDAGLVNYVVAVHDNRAGVWSVAGSTWTWVPVDTFDESEDSTIGDLLLAWSESWRTRHENPAFDPSAFNYRGREVFQWVRMKVGSEGEVRFRPVPLDTK